MMRPHWLPHPRSTHLIVALFSPAGRAGMYCDTTLDGQQARSRLVDPISLKLTDWLFSSFKVLWNCSHLKLCNAIPTYLPICPIWACQWSKNKYGTTGAYTIQNAYLWNHCTDLLYSTCSCTTSWSFVYIYHGSTICQICSQWVPDFAECISL